MPQIAQQDYIKAVATPGRGLQYDCNVFSVLAKALETGTIFDVIIVYDDSGTIYESRALSRAGSGVDFYDTLNSEMAFLDILYTSAQYAALSAIQLEADRLDEAPSDIPGLHNGEGYLQDRDPLDDYYICNPGGYKYAVTAADGVITSISVSDELAEGDYIVIDEETAQDLIGLPIE